MLEDTLQELNAKKTELVSMQTQLSSAMYAAEQSKDIIRDYMSLKKQKEELEKRLMELTDLSFLQRPYTLASFSR